MTCGRGKDFAVSMAALLADNAIDSALGSGNKSGFVFEEVGVAAAAGVPSYFNTSAHPQSVGNFGTGNRSFYSNETYVIYQQDGSILVGAWGTAAPPGTRQAASPAVPLQ